MQWQDVVIAGAQLVAVFSLLPSILSDDKPALATSAMNVALVGTIAFCLFSLELWFSGVTALAIALSWMVLAVQKLQSRKTN